MFMRAHRPALKPCQVPHFTRVTATVNCTPRNACRASTTGCKRRLHVLLQFLCETLEACAVFIDGADIFLKDDVLRR